MTSSPPFEDAAVVTLDAGQWQDFLDSLYERDDTLAVREPGGTYTRAEAVDAYTLSAHAEALQSADVDGDVWGTLEDIDETAETEEDAWAKITAFYLDRDCVLVRVTGLDEPEEWILARTLATRVGLLRPGA
ncbi:hypothetical protein [uncultured Deinococcus sp.]|uniref:hypothetical protein n=1 Tax=uncultured Deinococcus sp. TaxID=158789 RepID=UPI0025D5C681|nr:hypothetical protein [uncultured Deinococcus sp.]